MKQSSENIAKCTIAVLIQSHALTSRTLEEIGC